MDSEIDLSSFRNARDPDVKAQVAEWERKTQELRERAEYRKRFVSPPGSIPAIPELLDRRRHEHVIPDCCFRFTQPVYDRVLVYQIPQLTGDTYGGSSIVMTNQTQDYEKNMTPRGVLLAAGAKALDVLWSHGIEIGHIVNFIKYQQWRMRAGFIGTEEVYVMPMRAADIVASEDLLANIQAGTTRIERKDGVHMVAVANDLGDWIRRVALDPYADEEF